MFYEDMLSEEKRKQIILCETFFYQLLETNSDIQCKRLVNKQIRKKAKLSICHAIIPIHRDGNHWALGILTNLNKHANLMSDREPTIYYLDSLMVIKPIIR